MSAKNSSVCEFAELSNIGIGHRKCKSDKVRCAAASALKSLLLSHAFKLAFTTLIAASSKPPLVKHFAAAARCSNTRFSPTSSAPTRKAAMVGSGAPRGPSPKNASRNWMASSAVHVEVSGATDAKARMQTTAAAQAASPASTQCSSDSKRLHNEDRTFI